MANRLSRLLQTGAVAFVAACGGTASDDIVIRTDAEPAANGAAVNAAQEGDARAQAAGPQVERDDNKRPLQ